VNDEGAPEITGTVAEGFEDVRDAFDALLAGRIEDAAQVHAIVDGETVVDLAAGLEPDALVNTYSVTKAMAAFCALVLVDRGTLGLDEPIAKHWREYGRHGKDRTTLRQWLAHQAGVPQLRDPPTSSELFDHDVMCARIADEPPQWEPGTAHGEHALTYGHVIAELIRRTDGRDLHTFWRDEVAEPWGLDFHIGVPTAQLHRVHDLTDPNEAWQREMKRNDRWRPALADALHLDVVNSAAWRQAQIPAVNGHGTARAIARFYAKLLEPDPQLVSPATIDAMLTPHAIGPDRVTGHDLTWGLGVWVEPKGDFGMGGVGGSLGYANREDGLAYAYVTARMGDHERTVKVEDSLRAILRARPR
jgi:CubicO group peptidase (beta-lactamase class C family)